VKPMKRVRIILIILCFMVASAPCAAEENEPCLSSGSYLEPNILDKGRVDIKNQYGNTKGYVKRDLLDNRRFIIYDKLGATKGYIKTNPLAFFVIMAWAN